MEDVAAMRAPGLSHEDQSRDCGRTALVDVQITSISGPITRMSIDATCTLEAVKTRLEQEHGIPRHCQQLLADAKQLRDDETLLALSPLCERSGGCADRGPILLTLVQLDLQARDLELSQTRRASGGGATDYLVVARHVPTDTCCEHEYCCYHPQAGPVRPDPVTRLVVEEDAMGPVVTWEWSENSFDLASPGVTCRRPVRLEGGKLTWAGPCRSVKKVKPIVVKPPPAAPLAAAEEVGATDLDSEVRGEDLFIKHAPSSSAVEFSGSADDNRYENVKFTQAGGYARVEFRVRWRESGERGVYE